MKLPRKSLRIVLFGIAMLHTNPFFCQSGSTKPLVANTILAKMTRSFPPTLPIYASPYTISVTDSRRTGASELVVARLKEAAQQYPATFTSVPSEAKLHFTLNIKETSPLPRSATKEGEYHDEVFGPLTASLALDDGRVSSWRDRVDLRPGFLGEIYSNAPTSELQGHDPASAVDSLLNKVFACLYGVTQTFDVELPSGPLAEASQLGASGKWSEMLSALQEQGELANVHDESMRAYAIGIAREALAYQMKDDWAAHIAITFASKEYTAATKIDPGNSAAFRAGFRTYEAEYRILGSYDRLSMPDLGNYPYTNLRDRWVVVLEEDRLNGKIISDMVDEEHKTNPRGGGAFSGIVSKRHDNLYNTTFPWPPLTSTSRSEFPVSSILASKGPSTLAQVDDALINALKSSGYVELSHYAIPGGFALATRMEQIDASGTPLPPPDRWTLGTLQVHEMSLREWAQSLFLANAGYYRVIVFVVSDKPFTTQGLVPKSEEAKYWLVNGKTQLSSDFSNLPINRQATCTALIYEFHRDKNHYVQFLERDAPDAMTQLKNSGILTALHL